MSDEQLKFTGDPSFEGREINPADFDVPKQEEDIYAHMRDKSPEELEQIARSHEEAADLAEQKADDVGQAHAVASLQSEARFQRSLARAARKIAQEKRPHSDPRGPHIPS
jgi:hypothetical protein